MKIIAINEIHYTDADGKPQIALPGALLDRPKADAELLLKGTLPSARRLTDDEVELDKLRAKAVAAATATTATATTTTSASTEDEDEDEGTEEAKAPAKTETKPAATSTAKTAAKAAKGDSEGY